MLDLEYIFLRRNEKIGFELHSIGRPKQGSITINKASFLGTNKNIPFKSLMSLLGTFLLDEIKIFFVVCVSMFFEGNENAKPR